MALSWYGGPVNHSAMVSSAPAGKSEEQPPTIVGAPARAPLWRQWLEPAVAGAVISALVIALVSVGVAGFQSLKGDIRDTETRLTQQIEAVKVNIVATETRLSEGIVATEARLSESIATTDAKFGKTIAATEARLSESIAASEARQREDLKDLKADNRALSDKLDRVLESLLAAKT